ncbi:hypothetical protein GGD83_003885 [Rhodoblastus sphagnicola]|nr:hypothetical protein [Rhodoblastus sphagnicola]MBB4200058.1 hypothetical protein [Rhodoblastus sphagnicola]
MRDIPLPLDRKALNVEFPQGARGGVERQNVARQRGEAEARRHHLLDGFVAARTHHERAQGNDRH